MFIKENILLRNSSDRLKYTKLSVLMYVGGKVLGHSFEILKIVFLIKATDEFMADILKPNSEKMLDTGPLCCT